VESAPDQAFPEAAVACLDALYGFALALTRDREAAQDLVQETYLRALRARNRACGEGLRSWLFAILHNAWRNELRRRRALPYEGDLDALPADGGDPLQAAERQQSGNRLAAAIDALPPAFREVILLRCVEGFSYREMTDIVGCPAGTIMSRLARARGLLKRAVGPVAVAAAGGRER
jgi:RNA polymerase sigma-70 factor (ECF subfamily)